MKKIDVILVDDNKFFRKALRETLEDIPNIKVVGEAENGKVFLEIMKEIYADVVFMDVKMPEMNGIEATTQGKLMFPDAKFICLTMFGDETYFLSMVKAGVSAFLLKDTNKGEIENAIFTVVAGEYYFPDHFRKLLENQKL